MKWVQFESAPWMMTLFILFGLWGCTRSPEQGGVMPHQSDTVGLSVSVKDSNNKIRTYRLGEAVSVSRRIKFRPVLSAPNTFHLPPISEEVFELPGQFTGHVDRGGSCNVMTLRYIPHTITHLETAAHIMSPKSNPPTILDLDNKILTGILYLIDLTGIEPQEGNLVPWPVVKKKVAKIDLLISALAIKTQASELPEDYDFSGKNFLALAPETAEGIQKFKFGTSKRVGIHCLLLDLPSIDPEKDGGKLLAHRAFFGLPKTGFTAKAIPQNALVEMAYFPSLEEGYYYFTITPPRIQTNAVSTGITCRPLIEK